MKPMRSRAPAILFAAYTVAASASPGWAGGYLQSRCRALLQARDLRQTEVSLCVVDLDRAETLVSIHAEAPRIPASNMKLFTTAAAQSTLGASFTFRTTLSLLENEGDQKHPSLLLVGDGDPALADPKTMLEGEDVETMLARCVEAVRNAGAAQLDTLVIDDRVFDHQWVHPDWPREQLNRWYCAEVGGVNFHTNCLGVYPQPTLAGQSPTITLVPTAPFLKGQLRNRAVTGNADTFWISRKHQTNRMTFMGKVIPGVTRAIFALQNGLLYGKKGRKAR